MGESHTNSFKIVESICDFEIRECCKLVSIFFEFETLGSVYEFHRSNPMLILQRFSWLGFPENVPK
jgi:hypothetical protein